MKSNILIHLVIVLTELHLFSNKNLLYGQNHDAELIYQETNISVVNGTIHKSVSYEIKIYNRKGEKFTQVEIPYSGLNKVSKIEAYIKDNRGNIIKKLKKNDISDRSYISEGSFYEDNYIKKFTLKHNIYPYSISCSYQVQQREFFTLDEWSPVIDKNIPTLRAVLKLEVPKDYGILYSSCNIDSFNTDSSGITNKYKWKASYKDIITPEVFSPPIENFLPSVEIVPKNFKYDIPGSFDNWQTFRLRCRRVRVSALHYQE